MGHVTQKRGKETKKSNSQGSERIRSVYGPPPPPPSRQHLLDVRLTLRDPSVDGFALNTNYAVIDPLPVGKVDAPKLFLNTDSIILKC